jgi:hypothetical protein
MRPDSGFLKPAVVLSILLLAAYGGIQGLKAPRLTARAAPEGEFSVPRAMEDIRAISLRPHTLGSAAHDEVLAIIAGKWREMGFEPEVQSTVFDWGNGEAARVRNILVRLKGTSLGKALMLAGHYDSVPLSYGAADDGSSIAVLLETARAIKAGPPLKHDVIFLITDGEENGLLGARAFVKEHPWAADVGLVLNFEARGTSGPGMMFQTSRGNSGLIREFLRAAPLPRANSFAAAIYRMMPNDTDLTVFMAAGMQGLNFAFIGTPQDYHTPKDALGNLDPRSLAHQGSYALALARHFGSNGIPESSSSDTIYFNLIGSVVVRCSRSFAFLALALSALLLIMAGIRGLARKLLSPKKLLAAFAFLVAGIILAPVLNVLFIKLLGIAHGTWLPAADFENSVLYLLAAFALNTAVFLIFFRRRTGWPNFAFVSAVIAELLTLGALVALPGMSYLPGLPALILSILLAFLFGTKKEGLNSWPRTAAIAAGSVPALLVFVPLMGLFFTAMGLNRIGAIGIGLLAMLLLGFLAPSIELITRGSRRAWVLLAILAFIGCSAAGALTTRYTERHPRPTRLGYHLDFDGGKAAWFVRARADDPWISRIIANPRPGSTLAVTFLEPAAYKNGNAPAVDYAPPVVTKLEESTIGTGRVLKVRVASPRKAWMLKTFSGDVLDASAPIEGGKAVKAGKTEKGVSLSFTDPGPDGFTMVLENCRPGTISIEVEEWLLGLPELGDRRLPDPPSRIMPVQLATVLHKTYRF